MINNHLLNDLSDSILYLNKLYEQFLSCDLLLDEYLQAVENVYYNLGLDNIKVSDRVKAIISAAFYADIDRDRVAQLFRLHDKMCVSCDCGFLAELSVSTIYSQIEYLQTARNENTPTFWMCQNCITKLGL